MTAADGGGRASPHPWYRDAVIYQLHVKSFQDSNGDGIGDFAGLLSRLDYIAGLGVDALWLLPFYPSPRRDDGYDVSDYLGVSPDYGTLEDVGRVLDAAHARGLRVLGDLVLNHTSDLHPWFQRARRAPRGSEEHDFYVWSDSDQRYAGTRLIFPDVEKSNWSWDPVAGRYYFHRFYSHQPDLNYENPRVLEEMLAVLRFWLERGFDGFRLDAVAYLTEQEGTSNENLPGTHAVLKRLRAEMDAHFPDRVLLAEANQWPEDMKEYFGDDDECHMAFHFPLMPRMYMAVAQEDRFPVTDILAQTPPTPPNSQWAIFLRNHDELTLEMVTDAERDYLWKTYAGDPRARLNLGIRRRLAPLLQRDRRRIELMTSLLLTLPGTPVLYYGDEIGMGDDIHLGDRDGVRTPMQWSADRNGGFSRAELQRLVLPVITDAHYGFAAVNVETQDRDPHSLLHWVRGMLHVRRRFPGLFGSNRIEFLAAANRRTLAFLREGPSGRVLCVANFARSWQAISLDLSRFDGTIPREVLGGAPLPRITAQPYSLTLPPYGFLTLELLAGGELPEYNPASSEPAELPTLVLRQPFVQQLQTGLLEFFLTQALLPWLAREHGERLADRAPRFTCVATGAVRLGEETLAALHLERDGVALAPLLLGVLWNEADDLLGARRRAPARVRRGPRMGVVAELAQMPAALRDLVALWRDPAPEAGAALRASIEPGMSLPSPGSEAIDLVADSESARAWVVDGSVLLTLARGRADALDHVVATVRGLSRRRCPQVLRLIGDARLGRDAPHVFALAQVWRRTRGDARQWTLSFLQRAVHEFRAATSDRRREIVMEFVPSAQLLGSRLARLHRASALEFGNETIDGDERPPADDALSDLLERLAALRKRLRRDPELKFEAVTAAGRRLRQLHKRLALLPAPPCMRIHGDARLEHIRLTAADAYFIGFTLPPASLRHSDGVSSLRLYDLAVLLHGFATVLAEVQLAVDEGRLGATFAEVFLGAARRATVASYLREWDENGSAVLPPDEAARLEALRLRFALGEVAAASDRSRLRLALQALRS